MKKLTFMIPALLVAFCVNLQAQSVDSTFGTNGYVPYGASGNSEQNIGIGYRTAIQADGKILVGMAKANPNVVDLWFYTYRYNVDGTPDNTFGTNGVSKVFAGDQSINKDLLVQADGKIVVTGETKYCTNGVCGAPQLIVMRLKPNGELDSTFGTNGHILTTDVFGSSGLFANPERIIPTTDGKYLIAGRGIAGKPFVGRLNNNGTKDITFGTDGIYSETDYSVLVDLIMDNGGNIYGLLKKYNQNDTVNASDNLIIKLHANGTLDNSFGTGGRKVVHTANVENPTSFALRSDNKIVIVGDSQPVNLTGFDNGYGVTNVGYILILNPDGSPSSVLPQGFRTFEIAGDSTTFIHRVLVTQNNGLLISGRTITKISGNFHEKAFISHLDNTGNVDPGFNGTGTMQFDYGLHSGIGSLAGFNDLDVIAGGFILATGYRNPISANTTRSLFLLKLKGFATTNSNGITKAENNGTESKFYPNPWMDVATLEFELKTTDAVSVEMVDLTGKCIYSFIKNEVRGAGKYTETLNCPAGLPGGTYLLLMKTSKGILSAQKIFHPGG